MCVVCGVLCDYFLFLLCVILLRFLCCVSLSVVCVFVCYVGMCECVCGFLFVCECVCVMCVVL